MTTVTLRNIEKSFNQTSVLKDINLEINDGEFIVLVGPSGCGKSTLLRILAGLEHVSSGQLLLNNTEINDWSPKERNFSLIFQNYALFPHMSVEKNITFGMKVRGEDKSTFAGKVKEVADLLQLEPLLKRKPKELSGGQRQRVAMARAIVRSPNLFLMDEPLSNLDAKLRTDVRDGIIDLHNRLKTTTVYVTHDQIEAMTMADRIVVMNKGTIQQIGSPETLYFHPRNLFVATFIGMPAMNVFKLPIHANDVVLYPERTLSIPNVQFPKDAQDIYLGIRPEHMSHALTEDIREDNSFALEGTVTHRELHGAEYLLTIKTALGDLTYRIANYNGNVPALQSVMTLHIPFNQLHFFSTTTELNLTTEF